MTAFVRTEHYPHIDLYDAIGLIPSFLSDSDPRPAKEQLDTAYRHGGGWNSFKGFKFNPETKSITYPGDPEFKPFAIAQLRDETIIVYPHAWVAIIQKDGSFEISRMD